MKQARRSQDRRAFVMSTGCVGKIAAISYNWLIAVGIDPAL
jgi:hypothetical protein